MGKNVSAELENHFIATEATNSMAESLYQKLIHIGKLRLEQHFKATIIYYYLPI